MKNNSNYRFLKLLNSTNEAFYWLGFIYADGTLDYKTGRLRVRVSLKDEKFIANLSAFLDTKLIYETNNSVGIDIASKKVFPNLITKFKFKQNKTYNPPENLNFLETDDQFLAFLIGFIDGDGCIQKQYKRDDVRITIKCHKNWQPIFLELEHRLYKILKISRTTFLTKINNAGYVSLCISNHKICNYLKAFIIDKNLPAMKRKWSLIDTSKIYKDKKYFDSFKDTVIQLRKSGMTQKQIALKLNKSRGYICQVIHSRK